MIRAAAGLCGAAGAVPPGRRSPAGRRRRPPWAPGRLTGARLAIPYPASAAGGSTRSVGDGPSAAGSADSRPSLIRRHAVTQRRCSSSPPPQPAMIALTTSHPGLSSLPSAVQGVEKPTRWPACAAILRNDGRPTHSRYHRRQATSSVGVRSERIRPKVETIGIGHRLGSPRRRVREARPDSRLRPPDQLQVLQFPPGCLLACGGHLQAGVRNASCARAVRPLAVAFSCSARAGHGATPTSPGARRRKMPLTGTIAGSPAQSAA
jgi:hypothetical protein